LTQIRRQQMTTSTGGSMKEERKLSKVKISLMRDPMFALWQGVMMVGKTTVSDTCPTAATNGRDEIYGRKFIQDLSEKELAFVVLHESLHKAYRHMTTWHKLWLENPMLANMAMDYVINLELKDLDPHGHKIAMPRLNGKEIGLLDEKYRGMNTKQVYDLLKQQQDGGGGEGFDEHDWEGAQGLSEDEQKELAREIDQALRQGAMAHEKMNGKGAGGMSRELDDLLKPKVNWREVLREFVKSICAGKDASSWRRVNRRFLGSDTYMPTMISERVGHIVVGVDTSGSIGGKELNDFLSEVKGIAEEVTPERVDLLYWDSEVAGHEEYDTASVGNIIESTKPRGGGGTSPSCVSQYIKDKGLKPECVIMLTDGYVGSDWGRDWECPVLWVIVGNNTDTAPNGKTIHIN
jgi:predicted metal-dependent peptidase